MSERLHVVEVERGLGDTFDNADHLAHDALEGHVRRVRGEQVEAEIPEQRRPTRDELVQQLEAITTRMWDMRDDLRAVELERAGIMTMLKEGNHD